MATRPGSSNFWLRNFSFLFGFYCLLINWCRVKQFSNYCSMFGLYTFPILLITTSYLASVELLSVQDTPNANPDWSLTNMGYLNHCEAMLVSLNPYQYKRSFEPSKAKLSLLYLACLLLCQSPEEIQI